MKTLANYRATESADALTVHDVPIFLECKRGKLDADAEWIAAAVENARLEIADDYLAPLHILHHDIGAPVRRAGFFRITRAEPIPFRGGRKLAIFADLIVTEEWAREEVKAGVYPYRSVEIYDVEKPKIDSLALLDHEAPYHGLPMLFVDVEDEERETPVGAGVADATFRTSRAGKSAPDSDPLVAFFRRDDASILIFEDPETMGHTSTKPKPTAKPETAKPETAKGAKPETAAKFAEDSDDSDGGEEMETDGGIDGDAVVAAISDGTIPLAAFEAIIDAINARRASTAEGEPEEDEPAPAAAPGESMSARGNGGEDLRTLRRTVAKLQARVDAAEARDQTRTAAEAERADVESALERLQGCALGANLRGKLEAFRTKHGADAFADYVEELEASAFGDGPDDSTSAQRFRNVGGKVPAAAMKFQEAGPDAVAAATRFHAEAVELRERGHLRMSVERYVEVQMASAGLGAPAE